ncbi:MULTISPECIES: antibiotic biosynthesis monooxygenase [unclassified Streptomyces]|uniref:antibiotic biosynthesis monooxygenase family protein n=1 Tax=unclassified Streptomyces TaxID=2593676 RepID=UPI001BE7F239|nr:MULTISPECIES: antibiotic biosynthesis monooxygenase [unclassified Streptomyces]MBT2404162.1 antibiotic biosynthesis monooxygenase [Streptomyces sp. ISL-21]MBT2458947.1 antibiotic biosynthesis monooxygenase [Streptomyces sp. ISL-86]MBT2607178.1 antibiotic biosynthesis monooxygenase [Streptomyces sp. ISL-87]
MSIQPVPAFEPPYLMAVFTSVRTPDDSGYPETLSRMKEIVGEIPGFLGYESARNPGGLGITVAYFRDQESLTAWREDLEHQAAMAQGRADWYESYTLHVATVERSHGFARNG